MTKQEFAQKLKSKYPQYQNVDNDALTDKFLEKYPIYKSRITESGLQEGGEYGITLDKPQEVIAEEKPTGLLGKTSALVSKGFEKYAEIPAVKKFSAGVGGVTGILGGAIGGILGGVAETGRQIYRGVKGEEVNLSQIPKTAVQIGKETAQFGKTIGGEGAKIPPLPALGRVPNLVIGATQLYEGTKTAKQALEEKDALKGTQAATQLAMGALGTYGGVGLGKRGLLVSPGVKAQVKSELKEVGLLKKEPVETEIIKTYQTAIKPSITGRKTTSQAALYDNSVVNVVNDIKENKARLKIKDEFGEDTGKLPETVNQFEQAINQRKNQIYKEYSDLNKKAGQKGQTINYGEKIELADKDGNMVKSSILDDLDYVIRDRNANLYDPQAVSYAQKLKSNFENTYNLSLEDAQSQVEYLNGRLKTFYRNPSVEGITKAKIDALVSNRLRALLDDKITKTTGEGYQVLRNKYGDIKTIENDVRRRLNRIESANGKTLVDFVDVASGADIVSGIIGMSPSTIARGATIGAIKTWYKKINSPDYNIKKMFKESTSKKLPPSMIVKLKTLKPGLTIEDVSNNLLQEARKYKSAEEFVRKESFNPMSTYEWHLSDNPNLIEGKKMSEQIKPKNIGGRGFAGREENIGEIFSTKNPQYWYGQLEYDFPGKAPKYVYLVKIKNPTKPEIMEEIAQQSISKPEEMTIVKKAGSVNEILNPYLLEDVKRAELTDIWNKANSQKGATTPEALVKGGLISEVKPYKETGNLTTTLLKDLEGKTTVSKQYILDATNRPNLKQVEKEIIRGIANKYPDKIDVTKFANDVKAELLPLEVVNPKKFFTEDGIERMFGSYRYEGISLPNKLRGNVAYYREKVYSSPIKTSAGNVHFSGSTDNYFGHTRVEDMAGGTTRRVIEVQSDLYQKGNLEKEVGVRYKIPSNETGYGKEFEKKYQELDRQYKEIEKNESLYETQEKLQKLSKIKREQEDLLAEFNKPKEISRQQEIAKLQQYNDPTAHFRMVREEVKQAAKDGKKKLQFPTGETAMKIEGLSIDKKFKIVENKLPQGLTNQRILASNNIKQGMEITDGGTNWIITDVLGDGKFKAVQKELYGNKILENVGLFKDSKFNAGVDVGSINYNGEKYYFNKDTIEISPTKEGIDNFLESRKETFDISGKVDTNNPIYKFYEKDLGRYLKNNYNAKNVVDDKGVSWMEVDLTKKPYEKLPVEAFGFINIDKLIRGGLLMTGAGLLGSQALKATPGEGKNEYAGNLPESKDLYKPIGKKIKGKATVYNAEVGQTDSTPKITGFGTQIEFGDIAVGNRKEYDKAKSEFLKTGKDTYVVIPELRSVKTPYGYGIFRVRDTMNIRYNGQNKIDVYIPVKNDENDKTIRKTPKISYQYIELPTNI